MHTNNIHSDRTRSDETGFSALLEALPDAVYIIDEKGVILDTNSLFATQFNMQPQECIGTSVYDLIKNVAHLPELAIYHRERSEEVLRTGKRVVFADDRDIRKVTIAPLALQEEGITRLLITIQNISEQKQIFRELQKERSIKTTLLDAIPFSVIILDASLKMIFGNQYAENMLFSKPESEKSCIEASEFFCPEEMGMLRKKIMEILDSGIEDAREIEVHPHGSSDTLWLLSRTSRIFIDGQPCVLCIGIDITERKRSEIALRESKMRYSYALDASHSGIWEWNVKNDELSWSEQVWRLYGLKENSLPLNNQLCVDTVHADDREMAAWIIRNAVSKGSAASLEYRVIHPDGSVHWLTSHGMPLHDADGAVTRYIGTIIDITERKETEIALSESKTRLNQALKAASAGVWEWNLTTNENIWSDEIWPLFGLECTDGSPSFELWAKSIHNDDREKVIQMVSDAARNKTELNIEYRVLYPDCSIHWLLSRGKPICNDNGQAIRYIGTIIDITDQKLTELALSANKTRFSFALDATHAGVWEWDVTADKIIWSDHVWALYGLEPNSMARTHKLCASTVHPDDREVTFQNVMSAVQKEIDINMEYRVCHLDGSIHWLMCRGMPLLDENGQVAHYIGTVMDITERKERDREIVESRNLLKQALEAARAGTWEWNLITGENTWSEEARLLHGMKLDNPKPSFEFWASTIHPDDREMAILAAASAAENKTELYSEYRIYYDNNSIRWLMSRGMPLFDRDGNVERFIGTIIDITERKEIEEELRRSQERLNFILENSHIGVWDLNLQDGNTARTLEHAHIFGYETIPPVWSLENFFDHIIPEERADKQALILNAIEERNNYSFECRIHSAEGELRWISVTGAFRYDHQNDTGHVLGIVQDITGQKKVQSALRESELKFRTIFDHSPVAIAIIDVHDGKLFDVNNAWLRIFGYTKEEVIGKTIKELRVYMQDEDYENNVTTLNEHGKILNKPLSFRKKSGEIVHALYSGEHFTLEGRECILVMMTDITMQELQQLSIERLEQIVAERTEQLHDEMEHLRHFINMISHEYRTPLAIIRGQLNIIKFKNKSDDNPNIRHIKKIDNAINRLVEVMEIALEENRVIGSKTTLEPVPFPVAPLVDSQVESFRNMWDNRTILYTGQLDNAEIYCDPSQIKLAIFNLLDNARKYSPPASAIEMDSHIKDNAVVISIRNRSDRISPSEEGTVFEKYKRGSNAVGTAGAGLGLWLVKNIIDQHNGQISLSCIDKVTEITVRLPLMHENE
ncbi:PAS domain-containing protein [Chlorobium sp. BLA1]|uniref:PAS domain-containing sensor histidine kinase n=1 Tax=Candidatus Chlorobium masyuteum TaxID=2716876 RepID=UPI001422ABFD|nr:PAS domain-containing protein [Candidatus Chlorobium masyuteum]NHQ60707.1 PAS domain-containing protein [Candidatus Chlorobium masyuteum]NTU45342.1 PAS domain-containing protein [Chlorobiaceae bacterium]